jgi:Inorganic Pyrophosphatase
VGLLSSIATGLRAAITTYRGESVSASASKVQEKKVVAEQPQNSWAHASNDNHGPVPKQLSAQQPISREEWDFGDDYAAFLQAEQGQLQLAVQLIEACESDGIISGLLTTRSAGLLKLPLTIDGDEELVDDLVGTDVPNSKRSGTFWKMFPSATLARIIRFGIQLGAGVGYFVQGEDDECPVLHCVEHQFLFTRRGTDGHRRLYYRTTNGEIEVTPGDGCWFVFAPRGIDRFWLYGTWRSVGKYWIAKNMAENQRWTWGQRLARGIQFFTAPNSSTKEERDDVVTFMTSAITPPILAMLEGWKLENINVQGTGFEVWKDGKTDANAEIKYALTGQEATSGGTSLGLGNGEIFADIRQSFIDENAECLAEAIHYHGLTPVAERRGLPAPWATWNTTPPADQKMMAEAAKAAGEGLTALSAGLIAIEPDASKRPQIDVRAYLQKLNIAVVEQDELDPENVVDVNGIKVIVEWPEGSIRQGKASDGTKWATLMVGASYGEIVGTEGEDGDRIDAYVGPYTYVPTAYLLEQLREDGERDEFKVFLGFSSLTHAQATFRRLGRADLEGQWTELPVAMLRGMISGDASAANTTEQEATSVNDPSAPVATNPESQLFAYYLTSDVVKMNEARALAGQPRDERMADMYPSEWAARLRAEAAKATGVDPGAATQTLGEPGATNTNVDLLVKTQDLTGQTSPVPAQGPTIAASEDVTIDIPTDAEAVRLADELTLHKISRCEHGRVNECPKCGVERVRGVLVDESGTPVLDENGDPKWKIAWRAISPQKVAT